MTRPRSLVVILVAITITGCSNPATIKPSVTATNATSAPLLPRMADELPSMDRQGYETLLEQLRGTPLVVNFWASWCDPCREEMPLLAEAHQRLGREIQFLGVDMEDARDAGARFLHAYDVRYPNVFDPSNEIGLSLDLFAPPMTVFYDRDGAIVARVPGQLSRESLEEGLALLMP